MKKKMYVFVVLFIATMCVNLSSCSNNNNDDDQKETEIVPSSIIGKKITFLSDAGSYMNWTLEPINNTNAKLDFMTEGRYSFTKKTSTSAFLNVDGYQYFTTNTYIYKWALTLNFTSPNGGTFEGSYLKLSNGFITSVNGDFTIK